MATLHRKVLECTLLVGFHYAILSFFFFWFKRNLHSCCVLPSTSITRANGYTYMVGGNHENRRKKKKKKKKKKAGEKKGEKKGGKT